MKKIIGIISKRFPGGNDFKKGRIIEDSIINYFKRENTELISIICDEKNLIDEKILNFCDGFVFQGGSYEISDFHKQIFDFGIKNKKPIIGICLGMQFMGFYSLDKILEEKIQNISDVNHNDKLLELVHKVKSKKESHINRIFGDEFIVNSKHNDCLIEIGNEFEISAYSDDNIIEAIEHKNKELFVIGVQFHPETMQNVENLVTEFIKFML
ncbi:MAG: gamma-glutamyl-gamma-aminobutyrate hydrolase family protein [Bacilli bacterium]